MSKGRKIGMYGETPRMKIGKFTISRQDPEGSDDTLWVEDLSGIGGEFSELQLEEHLSLFFDKEL